MRDDYGVIGNYILDNFEDIISQMNNGDNILFYYNDMFICSACIYRYLDKKYAYVTVEEINSKFTEPDQVVDIISQYSKEKSLVQRLLFIGKNKYIVDINQ